MAPSSGFTFPDPPSAPTSIAHLLHSNAPPNSIEAGLTTSYIGELESQIVLLDEALASLQLRRADLVQSVKTHKPILSPIRRLPAEILGEIFSLVVHTTFHFGDISQVAPPVTRHAPWLFTRICRRWSDVALATPALWSLIFLDLDRVGGQDIVQLTNTCLHRSANVPLTVKILHEGHAGSANPHLILGAAVSSSERWGAANLYLQPPLLQQMTSMHSGFSALNTLLISIDLTFEEEDTFDGAFWDVFAVAPLLRSLQALCWEGDHFVRAPFSLPWHQLTRLSTTFASNTEALAALRKLSDIVECTFAISKTEILPVDYTTTRLPYLRSLALQMEMELEVDSYLPSQKHTSLLDFLETPCLQNLTTHKTADPEAVLGLITRSDCGASLASLHFHSCDSIDHSMMLRIAQKMPHLTSLVIGDFAGTLLPVSSVPEFIQAFSKQWIGATRELAFPDNSRQVQVRIVDELLDSQDARDITRMLHTLDKDGLFISVVPFSTLPNIIFERFDY
ncbi:hypothetical protein B0H14DRAFT_2436473 [Mycena olivaceomarginata]|nr:hypothetical protein B0H14DRAFT_2436473 [Mycena olivaceomarginata]